MNIYFRLCRLAPEDKKSHHLFMLAYNNNELPVHLLDELEADEQKRELVKRLKAKIERIELRRKMLAFFSY